MLKKAILIAAIMVAFITSGCKTRTVVVRDTRDSIVYRHRIDSVKLIHIDSVLIRQRGDTVFVDKIRYRMLESIKIDTTTVYVDKEKQVPYEVEKKVVPAWCWWLIVGYVLIFISIAIKIYLRIKR